MRKLLIGSAAVLGAALAATPAAAQFYMGYGYSPYSYGYSYPSYSYGYSYPSYSYSPYSYGYSNYSYSPYNYGYSSYGYPTYSTRSYYRTRAYYGCRLRRHHHDGIVYYTRSC